MQQLKHLLDNWILNKIQQYKTDQLKMTLGEAIKDADLYQARQATINYLEQEAVKRGIVSNYLNEA